MPLSQDQIDALLGGGGGGAAPAGGGGGGGLSPADIDALAELGTAAFVSGATAASQALGRKVVIGSPAVTVTSLDELKREYAQPMITINVAFTIGGTLEHALLLKERDGAII